MLFVELDLHSVVEFYLGAACISFDLYDLVVGIVVGDVLGDRCRDDSGRNGAVLAIDVGPLALAVELDLVAVFERDFIAFPKIGFFFGIIRKSKCSTDFKRNDFLKKNEAYPLGALRSLKFAYRKLRISLFVELAV